MNVMSALNAALPESPQGRFWTWVVGIVAGTAAVLVGLDATFARKAEAVSKLEVDGMIVVATGELAKNINLNTEYLLDQQSKKQIDTQLAGLEAIPPVRRTPQESAVLEKLKRERAEIVDLWIRRGKPLR